MLQVDSKIHHAQSWRRHRPMRMRLIMVPLIDVVFLLLVFFLLTANFRSQEAFLPVQLPQQATGSVNLEIEPLFIYIDSLPNGDCRVQIGDIEEIVLPFRPGDLGFDGLSRRLGEILNDLHRKVSDPVKLVPTPTTKWDHVVKTYDALGRLSLTNIIFTFVDK